MLNSRPILALYAFLLWPTVISMLVVGYSSYKRANLRLDRKLNMAWSRYFNDLDRLRLQSNLHCCGFYTPLHQATFSRNCYPRTTLPGCKGKLYRYEMSALKRLYTFTFTAVFIVLGCIVSALLCTNHVNETFGKGLTPRSYRLDMTHVRRNALGIMRTLAENFERKQIEREEREKKEKERLEEERKFREEMEREELERRKLNSNQLTNSSKFSSPEISRGGRNSFQEIELGDVNPNLNIHRLSYNNHDDNGKSKSTNHQDSSNSNSNTNRSSLYLRPAQAVNLLAKHLDPRQYISSPLSFFSPSIGGNKPLIPPKSPNRSDRKDWNSLERNRQKKAYVEDQDEDEGDTYGTIRIIDTSKKRNQLGNQENRNKDITGLGLTMQMEEHEANRINKMRQV